MTKYERGLFIQKERVGNIGNIAMFFYILACILSLGIVWLCKVVIQKAIIDSRNHE